ncbi:MAG: 50S ribosomal protein L11 methyltransferase [Nanoarchaeota archaeon]|nr:50S ribosomal protein L11 methyltransferase [DPANN group archaeon]MBL7116931.1 50S ribosomal protein L11 methyltransferase [Nanoarchaeota archaeon]
MSDNYKIIKREYQGIKLKFVVNESTYKPDKFTRLMANSININKGNHVCDVGTGSGALTIVASKLGAKRIVSIEIDEKTEKPFLKNCKMNTVKNVRLVKSDLLTNVKSKFDVIIANLPQIPYFKKEKPLTYGGWDGTKHLCKAIKQASSRLKKGGELYLNGASITNKDKIIKTFSKYEFKAEVIGKSKTYFTKELANKTLPLLFEHFMRLQSEGTAKIYKDKNRLYYYFFVYKGIKGG